MVAEHAGEHESRQAAVVSIAAKRAWPAETLQRWVRQGARDKGVRLGRTTAETDRIKALERENRELRQASEILPTAPAYFAQAEIDRPLER